MNNTMKLVERLRREEHRGLFNIGGGYVGNDRMAHTYGGEKIMQLANPDGPEAADTIESLQARVKCLEEALEAFVDIEAGTDATGFTPTVEQMLMDLAAEARTTLANQGGEE